MWELPSTVNNVTHLHLFLKDRGIPEPVVVSASSQCPHLGPDDSEGAGRQEFIGREGGTRPAQLQNGYG